MKKRYYYPRRGVEPRPLQTKNAIIWIWIAARPFLAGTLAALAGTLAAPPAIAQTVTLDTLIVYTPLARTSATTQRGGRGIEALTDLMVAETNQALRDSELNVRVRMVGRREISYVEPRDTCLDLQRLQSRDDGYMDIVHQWRFDTGADLVHLILGDYDYIGCAYYAINTPSPDYS